MAIPNPTHYWSLSTRGQAEDTAPGGSDDGTISGATHTTNGIMRGAYSFDGTDDYVDVVSPSFLSDTSGTISLWIDTTNVDPDDTLWGSGDEGSGTKFFYVILRKDGTGNNNDRINLVSYDGGYNYNLFTPEDSVSFDGWHHFVFTSDGSTVKVYIDGVDQALTAVNGSNNGDWFGDITGLDNFTLGTMEYNSGTFTSYLNASLGEVSYFDSDLSQAEVTELYNSGSGKFWNQVTEAWEEQDSLRNGLVNAYNFNGDVLDDLGSVDGTNSGTASGTGVSAQGRDFSSGDYITLDDSMNLTDAATWSFWINTTDANNGRLIFKNNASPNRSYIYGLNNGVFNMTASTDGSTLNMNAVAFSHSAINDGSDHHIMLSYDGSAQTVKLYIDGSLADTLTSGDGVPTSINTNTVDATLNTSGSPVVCMLDEVYFYDEALGSTEATSLYNSGTGKVFDKETQTFIDGDELRIGVIASYSLDENVLDNTIESYDGTISGATSDTANEKLGTGCYDFDGNDDYVVSSVNPSVDIGDEFTLAFWFKPDAINNNKRFFTNNEGSLVGQVNSVGDSATIYLYNGSGNEEVSFSVVADSWHFIGITGNLTNYAVYLNSSLAGGDSWGGIDWSSANQIIFGCSRAYDRHFDGKIDEVGIWNRALTSTEISTLYNTNTGLAWPYIIGEDAEVFNAIWAGMNF